jgi:hypothetical protein
MTWATGTADAPRLWTYQEAAAHEAKIVPIRGRVPECKPLARRDCTNLTIRKEKRNIIVQSWGITITYRPGGAIDIRVDYRASNADRTLLARLLGVAMFVRHGITWIGALDPANPEHMSEANLARYVPKMGYYPMKTKWVEPEGNRKYRRMYMLATLRPVALDSKNSWHKYAYTMDNIVYPKSKTLARKGAAAVRARYKPLLTLLSGYLKMTADQEVPQARYAPLEASMFFKDNKAKLRGDKHPDKQLELIKLVENNSIEHFHTWNSNGGWNYGRRVNADKAKKHAVRLVHEAHPGEAYKITTVTTGEVVKNRY